jgi:hypothetical protein
MKLQRPIGDSRLRSLATTRPPPGFQPGSRRTCPKPSPASASLPLIGGSCEPTMDSNDSIREIKRRTHVATLFLNEASLLRLVLAVLSEISDTTVLLEHESQMTRPIMQAFIEEGLLYRLNCPPAEESVILSSL